MEELSVPITFAAGWTIAGVNCEDFPTYTCTTVQPHDSISVFDPFRPQTLGDWGVGVGVFFFSTTLRGFKGQFESLSLPAVSVSFFQYRCSFCRSCDAVFLSSANSSGYGFPFPCLNVCDVMSLRLSSSLVPLIVAGVC